MAGEKVQYITFQGSGLNSDDAEAYIGIGDSKVDADPSYTTKDFGGRRNVIPSSDDGGKLETALGNALVDDELSFTNTTNTVLGYATDHENDKLYFFVQGLTGTTYTNSILEFDPLGDDDDTAFTKVIWEDGALEFEADKKIKGAEVIDGWIYYNGGTYGLKKVNITFAKNYTDYDAWVSEASYTAGDDVRVRDGRIYNAKTTHSGESTDPRSDSTNWEVIADTYAYPCDSSGDLEATSLSRTHVPPTSSVSFVYDSDATKEINNLRGKLFQFTYRYKYREHGYSRTAPVSNITLPEDDESIEGEVKNAITTNNHLDLAFQPGALGVVEWVELFVREGNSGTWYYVKRFEDGESSYAFYNDVALEAMDDTEINTMADAIPKQSNTERYISENVMLSGGNTEGYDNIDLDVSMTKGFSEMTITTPDMGAENDSFTISESVIVDELFFYGKFNIDDVATDTSQNDYIAIYVASSDPYYVVDAGIVFRNASGGGSEEDDFKAECIAAINGAATGITAGDSDVGFSNYDNGDFWVRVPYSFYGDASWVGSYIKTYDPVSGEPDKWSALKTGAMHKYGLQYYDDQMRPFAAMTSSDTEVYIPTIPEEKGSTGSGEYKWRPYVSWAISHAPPADAAYWQWLYAGNQNISNFWTYVIAETDGATQDGTDYTLLDISPLNNAQTIYPKSNVSYTHAEGDRVRILTKVSSSANSYGELVEEANISDVEIIDYDSTNEQLKLPYDSDKYHAGNSSLIEIYRPKTTAEEIVYYTIGPVYETYTSGGTLYHRGGSQDQTATNGTADAEGTITRGDVYFTTRAFSEALAAGGSVISTVYFVESPSYSDFYASDSYDYGKINVESDLGETYLNDIRWSNVYIQDTYINGLCTYDSGDYTSLPNRNGEIQAMEQVGDMLRVYQEDKTTSIWVGRSETIDTQGTASVSRSTSVLGSQREQMLEYGTLNPESVIKTDKYVYGYDIQNGVFWRDSMNGLFPISGRESMAGNDYKMEHYFTNISKSLLESGVSNVNVLTEWDGEYKLLYVTFEDSADTDNNETLAFHEPTNRWFSFYDIFDGSSNYPDFFMRYKNYFYSFLSGALYKHNKPSPGTGRATFYGSKKDVYVDVVLNAEANLTKILEAIGLHTAGDWTVDEVNIEADASYTNGMLSEIGSSYFDDIEGIQRAAFLRNKKTRTSTANNWDLHNGERLRGRTAQIVLKNTSTSETKLLIVEVIYTSSKI